MGHASALALSEEALQPRRGKFLMPSSETIRNLIRAFCFVLGFKK
jgi:hypothetical protein